MYGGRGGGGKGEMVDRKRMMINDAMDKHLEKSSPSTSRGDGKAKDEDPISAPSTPKGKYRLKHNCSDGESETDSEESDVSGSDGDDGDMCTEEQNHLLQSAAENIYGLIHVRYLLTNKGMAAMLEKYKNYDFGRCPRVYCCREPCLPVGQSDIPRSSTVIIYCPKCEDIYYPRSKYQGRSLFWNNISHPIPDDIPALEPTEANNELHPKSVWVQDSQVQDSGIWASEEARRSAERAYEVAKVDERVNRSVNAANRVANAARVAAVKAVQKQMHHRVSNDHIPLPIT